MLLEYVDTIYREEKFMTVNLIYAIYDDASEAFVQMLPSTNEKLAKMTFEKMFKDKRFGLPLLYDYPESFSIYQIATFDDNTGKFENLPTHKLLLNFGTLCSSDS